jgi:hypothetical protein
MILSLIEREEKERMENERIENEEREYKEKIKKLEEQAAKQKDREIEIEERERRRRDDISSSDGGDKSMGLVVYLDLYTCTFNVFH